MAAKSARTDGNVAAARGTGSDGLTLKQRRFIEAYISVARGNATEAARMAGYTGSDETLAVTGHENLRKPKVAEALRLLMARDLMPLEEAKARLTDQARGRGECLIVVDACSNDSRGIVTARWRVPAIDWDALVAGGTGHLVKRITENAVEATDALSALRLIIELQLKVEQVAGTARAAPQRAEVDLSVIVHGVACALSERAERVRAGAVGDDERRRVEPKAMHATPP